MDAIVSIQMTDIVHRTLSTDADAQTLLANTDPLLVAEACGLSQGFLEHAARNCVAHILGQVKTLARQAASKRREAQFKAAFVDDLSRRLSASPCPITHADFTDAVVAADGIVYESVALQKWIAVADDDNNVRSPSTNAPMSAAYVQSSAVQKMANDIVLLKQEAAEHAWLRHSARKKTECDASAAEHRQPYRRPHNDVPTDQHEC